MHFTWAFEDIQWNNIEPREEFGICVSEEHIKSAL